AGAWSCAATRPSSDRLPTMQAANAKSVNPRARLHAKSHAKTCTEGLRNEGSDTLISSCIGQGHSSDRVSDTLIDESTHRISALRTVGGVGGWRYGVRRGPDPDPRSGPWEIPRRA